MDDEIFITLNNLDIAWNCLSVVAEKMTSWPNLMNQFSVLQMARDVFLAPARQGTQNAFKKPAVDPYSTTESRFRSQECIDLAVTYTRHTASPPTVIDPTAGEGQSRWLCTEF